MSAPRSPVVCGTASEIAAELAERAEEGDSTEAVLTIETSPAQTRRALKFRADPFEALRGLTYTLEACGHPDSYSREHRLAMLNRALTEWEGVVAEIERHRDALVAEEPTDAG